MASVFLSHSSKDGQVVEAIAGLLRGDGNEVFLDRHPEDGIAAGEQWEQVLYDRLHEADVLVAVVTAHHVESEWCFAEVALAKALGRTVVPLRAEAGATHPLLRSTQGVDLVAQPDAARVSLLDRLRMLDAGGGGAPDPGRSLFPGLGPFETEDAAVFFGREREVRDLAAAFRSRSNRHLPRAVTVVGASGTGKSSLVRAGLVRHLVADGWWTLPPVVPAENPVGAVGFAFGQAFEALDPAREIDLVALTDRVRDDLDTLAGELLLAAPGRRHGLMVIVDQFEEIFARTPAVERAAILDVLTRASEPGRRTAVVMTMRSEFQSDLLACEAAGPLRQGLFPLAPLARSRLASVITGPARKGRVTFDDELVEQLVEETGSGEALPLLAYVLRELTDGARPGDRVTMADHASVGGVHGALRTQAEDALRAACEVTDLGEAAVLGILIELVSVDTAGRPSRRRVRGSSLDPDAVEIVRTFVAHRLVSSDDDSGEPTYSVSHEALFAAWPRLRDAVIDHGERLQLRRRLEQAADDWDQASADRSMLWRGDQLSRAGAAVATGTWRTLDRRFVAASAGDDQRARRREADILADRIRSSGLIERDSELALLLLLVAADELAVTDGVIGGLRGVLARHRLLWRARLAEGTATAVAVSTDGRLVAVADTGTNAHVVPSTRAVPQAEPGACHVTIWQLPMREPIDVISLPGRRVAAVAITATAEEWRVAVHIDQQLVIRGPTTSGATTLFIPIDRPVAAIGFAGPRWLVVRSSSDEHQTLDLGAEGGEVVWRTGTPHVQADDTTRDALTPEETAPLPPFSLRAHSRPSRLVADVAGGDVAVWGLDPVDTPRELARIGGPIKAIRWTNHHRFAVTVDGRVVDVPTGHERYAFDRVCAVSADGRKLMVGDPPRIVDVATGAEVPLPEVDVRDASFSADGTRVAIAEWGALSVFDVATGERIATLGMHDDEEGDLYTGVALTTDGARVVSASLGGTRAYVWDLATRVPLAPLPPSIVDVSPDGAGTVVRGLREIAADVSAGVELHLGSSSDAAFVLAPDRRSIVVLGGLGSAEEYSVPEGHLLFSDTAVCTAATFTFDSNHLILARPDGAVVESPARHRDEVLARARRFVFRTATNEERGAFALPPAP